MRSDRVSYGIVSGLVVAVVTALIMAACQKNPPPPQTPHRALRQIQQPILCQASGVGDRKERIVGEEVISEGKTRMVSAHSN